MVFLLSHCGLTNLKMFGMVASVYISKKVCLYVYNVYKREVWKQLPETIVAEMKLKNKEKKRKKIFFVLSYCHPNFPSTEFDEYVKSFEPVYECINKENPAVTIITGDFNARSPLFWENDSENREGRVFNKFLISNNLEKLINEPTHIRDDGSQSCIDLICTDQPYIFTASLILNIILFFEFSQSTPPPPAKRGIIKQRKLT